MAIGSTDAEVRKIINESHDEAKRLLTVYRKQLDALAEALVARETLNEQEVLRVTELPPARPWTPGWCSLTVGTAKRQRPLGRTRPHKTKEALENW